MPLLVYSVVRRHMRRTSSGAFTRGDAGVCPVSLSLEEGEEIVGWYTNPAPWLRSRVVFTSLAIWAIEGERANRIANAAIVGYEEPKSKTDIDGLCVVATDGPHFVRVAGSFGPHGIQKDAFSFLMVVRAIASANARTGSLSPLP